MEKSFKRREWTLYWGLILSLSGYVFLSYYTLRHERELVLGIFVLLTINYYRLYQLSVNKIELLIGAAILFRILLLPAVPNLTEDFYRFIWDGRLLNQGIDPFESVPSFYMLTGNEVPGLTEQLYSKLNSPEYFTIYPPINQAIFWMATAFFPNSVYWSMVVMKLIVVVADLANIFILRHLLLVMGLPERYVLLYALNPLVIIETAGNLHFEALMLLFLLGMLVYWQRSNMTSGSNLVSTANPRPMPATISFELCQ
jgi:hypothetical protein